MNNVLPTLLIIVELMAWPYLIRWFIGMSAIPQKYLRWMQLLTSLIILVLFAMGQPNLQFIAEMMYAGILLFFVKPKGFVRKVKQVVYLVLWLLLPGFLVIYFCSINGIFFESQRETVISNISYLIIYFVIFLVIKKRKVEQLKIAVTKLDALFTWIVFIILNLLNFSIIAEDSPIISLQTIGSKWILNLLGVALTFLVLFLYLTIWRNSTTKYYQAVSESKEKYIKNQITYFKMYKATQNDIRSFRHDFNRHLATLNQLAKAEKLAEILSYLDEIDESWRETGERLYQTGDEVLDSILNLKVIAIREKEIDIIKDGVLAQPFILSPYELTIVFANALDNAIAAVSLLDREQRKIFFTIKNSENFSVITIANPIASKTTKAVTKDKRFHGFGLTNIKNIIKKYKGTMEVIVSDKNFKLTIILPKVLLVNKK